MLKHVPDEETSCSSTYFFPVDASAPHLARDLGAASLDLGAKRPLMAARLPAASMMIQRLVRAIILFPPPSKVVNPRSSAGELNVVPPPPVWIQLWPRDHF